jgi:hypothetical protein
MGVILLANNCHTGVLHQGARCLHTGISSLVIHSWVGEEY